MFLLIDFEKMRNERFSNADLASHFGFMCMQKVQSRSAVRYLSKRRVDYGQQGSSGSQLLEACLLFQFDEWK